MAFCAFKLNAQKTSFDSLAYFQGVINNPKNNSQLLAAYKFYKLKTEASKTLKDTLNQINDLYYLAKIQNNLGVIYESETSAIDALTLLDEVKPSQWTQSMRLSLYNQLGITCRKLFKYKQALNYYNSALDITDTPIEIAKLYGNRGVVYAKMEQPDLAIIAYETALAMPVVANNDKLKARLLDNVGTVRSQFNRVGALDNLEEALAIRKRLNYDQGLLSSFLNLSEHYHSMDETDLAIGYMNQALELADRGANRKYLESVISKMIDQGDNSRAAQYKTLTDSAKTNTIRTSSKYAEAAYNYTKQEKIAKQNALESDQQKRAKQFYLVVALLILTTAIGLYLWILSKHKKEKLQQVYLTESRISKQIHDDVSNDLFQVMTKLESKTEIGEDLKEELNNLYYRTRDISKEHSVINNEYPFIEYLGELIESFNDDETSVIVKGVSEIPWDTVEDLKRTTIYKVLQELLINMRKHSEASVVVLSFKKQDKKIKISYSDNGRGCDLKMNTGLQNTENRIDSINGIISFETEPNQGFKSKISL